MTCNLPESQANLREKEWTLRQLIFAVLFTATLAGCGGSGAEDDVRLDGRSPNEVVLKTFTALADGNAELFCDGLTDRGKKVMARFLIGSSSAAQAFNCKSLVRFVKAVTKPKNLKNYRELRVSQTKVSDSSAAVTLAGNGLVLKLRDGGQGWQINSLDDSLPGSGGGNTQTAKPSERPGATTVLSGPKLSGDKCQAPNFPEACSILAAVVSDDQAIAAIVSEDPDRPGRLGIVYTWNLPFSAIEGASQATAIKQTAQLVRRTFRATNKLSYIDLASYDTGKDPFSDYPKFEASVEQSDVSGDPIDAVRITKGGL